MIYTVRINDKEYEVEVERGRATLLKTTETIASGLPAAAAGAPVSAAVPAVATVPSPIQEGATAIRAPMPGTILELRVSPGKSVRKGEVLLILEAMKMENEVVAPADGTVAQVFAAKGASVDTDDVLITLQ